MEFNNVDVSHRQFHIHSATNLEDKEVEVKVGLKKDTRMVDMAARKIQTTYKAEDPIYVSLKRISR